MRKGFLLAVVVVLVLAMAVPAALALSDNQKVELQKLYEQQHQLRLQIVEKQAEGGIITKEEAATMKERMADGWEYQQERMSEGNYSFGPGRRGRGGYGSRGSGCGYGGGFRQGTTTTSEQSSAAL